MTFPEFVYFLGTLADTISTADEILKPFVSPGMRTVTDVQFIKWLYLHFVPAISCEDINTAVYVETMLGRGTYRLMCQVWNSPFQLTTGAYSSFPIFLEQGHGVDDTIDQQAFLELCKNTETLLDNRGPTIEDVKKRLVGYCRNNRVTHQNKVTHSVQNYIANCKYTNHTD